MVHEAIEAHFKEGIYVGRFRNFLEQFKKWKVDEEGYLGKKLKDGFFSLCENVQKWINETELDISRENVLSVEAEVQMPIRGEYHLTGHADLITKTHIIDLKSGRTFRDYGYMKQLGAYRDLARFMGLHDESLTGDFELVNVFFGGDGFGELFYSQSEIDRVMPEFYSSFFELVAEDENWRGNKEYMMPCRLSTKCAFCDYRGNPCRGI